MPEPARGTVVCPQIPGDAVALALLPKSIRGFGHVRHRAMAAAAPQRETLRKPWD
jgi:hypothetical protein